MIREVDRSMRLCSACLLGIPCRYDGTSKPNVKVLSLSQRELLIPICPEQLGGLPTPREAAERKGSHVVTESGQDVTAPFRQGADAVVLIAKRVGAKEAILKQKSPSCGCGKIFDGTFSGKLIDGDGLTTEALKKAGVAVISEEELF